MLASFIFVVCTVEMVLGWSFPFYPVHPIHGPMRMTSYSPPQPFKRPDFPHSRRPIPEVDLNDEEQQEQERGKRNHDDDYDQDDSNKGITGPVHTFVKTDKNANYKWGVRHHVGSKYAP